MDTVSYIDHVCIRGEMWDSLALDYYGEETLCTYIMRANKEYTGTVMFEGGERLKIPILEDNELPESLPPWRR